MTPERQRIAMAELDGFVWYRERNGTDATTDYWGVARFALPPMEGVGFEGRKGTVSETRYMTQDEIAEAIRTGGFYTYAPEYLDDLNAVARVVTKITEAERARYFAYLHGVLHKSMMSFRYQQWLPVIDATAAQRVNAILRATGRWVD